MPTPFETALAGITDLSQLQGALGQMYAAVQHLAARRMLSCYAEMEKVERLVFEGDDASYERFLTNQPIEIMDTLASALRTEVDRIPIEGPTQA